MSSLRVGQVLFLVALSSFAAADSPNCWRLASSTQIRASSGICCRGGKPADTLLAAKRAPLEIAPEAALRDRASCVRFAAISAPSSGCETTRTRSWPAATGRNRRSLPKSAAAETATNTQLRNPPPRRYLHSVSRPISITEGGVYPRPGTNCAMPADGVAAASRPRRE